MAPLPWSPRPALARRLSRRRKRKPKGKRAGKRRRPRRGRITTSTLDRYKTVRESPRQLLAQARQRMDPEITLDELTAARLIVSEHARGSRQEMAAMVDAELTTGPNPRARP